MGRAAILPTAALAVLIAAIVLALIGATGLGALHSGGVPQFQQIVAVGPNIALVVENGPFCVPDAPLAACHSAVRQEFRVWYYASKTKHEILAYAWEGR